MIAYLEDVTSFEELATEVLWIREQLLRGELVATEKRLEQLTLWLRALARSAGSAARETPGASTEQRT